KIIFSAMKPSKLCICIFNAHSRSPSIVDSSARYLSTLIVQLPISQGDDTGKGACGPSPPVVAPLVTRCALLPAATPRDVLSALGTPCKPIASEPGMYGAGEAPSCGGWGREGVRSEARAEQRLAPGGPQAPITRTKHWRAALPLTRKPTWDAAPLTRIMVGQICRRSRRRNWS